MKIVLVQIRLIYIKVAHCYLYHGNRQMLIWQLFKVQSNLDLEHVQLVPFLFNIFHLSCKSLEQFLEIFLSQKWSEQAIVNIHNI